MSAPAVFLAGAQMGGAALLAALAVAMVLVGSEILLGYSPAPISWKHGPARFALKALLGCAMGFPWLWIRAAPVQLFGAEIVAGALVVGFHDGIKWILTNQELLASADRFWAARRARKAPRG